MEGNSVSSLVKLLIKSSNTHPLKGVLPEKENIIAAIDLAKHGKEFADQGQTDEAMHYDSPTWQAAIDELESKLKSVNEKRA